MPATIVGSAVVQVQLNGVTTSIRSEKDSVVVVLAAFWLLAAARAASTCWTAAARRSRRRCRSTVDPCGCGQHHQCHTQLGTARQTWPLGTNRIAQVWLNGVAFVAVGVSGLGEMY
jgi:hypothetical protein